MSCNFGFCVFLGAEETSFSMLSGSRKKKVGQTNWNVALEKLNVTSYFQPDDPIVVVRNVVISPCCHVLLFLCCYAL